MDELRNAGGDDGERLAAQERRLLLLLAHLAGRAVRARVELDDLVQEVYLRALADPRGLPAPDGGSSEGPLWGVLSQHARHVVVDVARALRASKRQGKLEPLRRSDWSRCGIECRERGPGPHTAAATLESSRVLARCFLELSAEHGDGVYELLEAVVERLPAGGHGAEPDAAELSVAFVGRPNVGKSSLVNRLLRTERVMVSEMPGTTRDAVDVLMNWHKRQVRILDTAGMRRPGRVAAGGPVEAVSVVLSRRAMTSADVVVLVVDATEGAGDREGAIAGEAEAAGCGIVIAVNKWDLVRGQGQDWVKAVDDKLRFQLKFMEYAPIVHVSALTGEHAPRLLEVVDRVGAARKKRVSTAELNRFLESVTAANPPTSKNSREVRILYGAQAAVAPPSFVLFTNVATEFHFSYERFLANRLRESFGLLGTPLRLQVRKR